jgi:hypothetical protein
MPGFDGNMAFRVHNLKKKRLKAAPKKRANLIRVVDEQGRVIYSGLERRAHSEQVFFDSENVKRRFMGAGKISKKRRKELKRLGGTEKFLGVPTFPSQRSTKHKIKGA